jgi:hypothetical protein
MAPRVNVANVLKSKPIGTLPNLNPTTCILHRVTLIELTIGAPSLSQINLKGLAQPMVSNIVGHLASSMSTSLRFESS